MQIECRQLRRVAAIALVSAAASQLYGQVSQADYKRAAELGDKYRNLAENIASDPEWIQGEHAFVYAMSNMGDKRFLVYDADTGKTTPAFDQERLAAALKKVTHADDLKAGQLPFSRAELADGRKTLRFTIGYAPYTCDLTTYVCKPRHEESGEDPNADNVSAQNNLSRTVPSPDGRWDAFIENYNVVLRSKDGKDRVVLSTDGSEGDYYELRTIAWSPDATHLVAYRNTPGYKRDVHYIESSPKTQLQPLYISVPYTKPGDVLDVEQPVVFDVAGKQEHVVDRALFPNAFDISEPVWRKDIRAFTFEYNQRGHQVYRVLEVDKNTGIARTVINEETKTFIDYRPLVLNQQDTGKRYRHDLDDGKEIVWMSERDGWAHLYLLDGSTGAVKQQITKGPWVVRAVNRVDEGKRQIWFEASGMRPGEDPYFVHAYRINFDGSGLVPMTEVPGNHQVEYSTDGTLYTDLVSTATTAPILSLHEAASGKQRTEIAQGSMKKMVAAGWRAPEVFKAKGRDGVTDIWGLVWKPANFDPKKKYPVVENIYAGPQGSFVPKTFTTRGEPLTELGFVVVQIDGMGTNNRSKAFHDVAFKNLKDAGFPDRIAWQKAYGATHPWFDLSRVGIFGTSAGGQSAMGALLFHPEFYKVAVANSGCHDNRMDKIWWNEQWMSWPIGPQYSESSNVDNAWRLQGKLMLVVGEMDTNVDPSSTFQVADRLEKANKYFDLLYVPGGGHGAGGAYGQRKLEDFFVTNLLHEPVPNWNAEAAAKP